MLHGRQEECAVLDGLLEGARAGQSGVLLVRGAIPGPNGGYVTVRRTNKNRFKQPKKK